jgi:hypothetical protein
MAPFASVNVVRLLDYVLDALQQFYHALVLQHLIVEHRRVIVMLVLPIVSEHRGANDFWSFIATLCIGVAKTCRALLMTLHQDIGF